MEQPPNHREEGAMSGGEGGPGRWTWSTRVRIDEVGPEQRARPRSMVHWMQEAAGTASEALGYSRARFRRMGAAWFIRELTLQQLQPIPFGAKLEVETWVYDLRRFRSEREYRLVADGVLAARAAVEWLFLDAPQNAKLRPRHPDSDMKAAFVRIPERVLVPDEVLTKPMAVPQAPPSFSRSRVVEASDLDDNDHANHAAVLGWFDDLARATLGLAVDLSAIRIRYEEAVRHEDVLQLCSWERGDGLVMNAEREGVRVASAVARYAQRGRD